MAMAKKTDKAEKPERELVPLTVYLPRPTIERIDHEGGHEDRRRGAMGRRLIDEALDARDAKRVDRELVAAR